MVQFIVGKKGKGKTKHLLEKVNEAVKTATGNLVYLDKNAKNMFELNNRIRLINVSEYLLDNSDEFVGFISGIISQDHDLEGMYLDNFLINSCLEGKDIVPTIKKLEKISDKYNISFTINISIDQADFLEELKDKIILAL